MQALLFGALFTGVEVLRAREAAQRAFVPASEDAPHLADTPPDPAPPPPLPAPDPEAAAEALRQARIAEAAETEARWEDALMAWNAVIHATPSAAQVVRAYVRKALILDEHLARPDKAAAHLERARGVDPARAGLLGVRWVELLVRHAQERRARDAMAQVRAAPITPAASAALLLCEAVLAHRAGVPDLERALLAQAVALDPGVAADLDAEGLLADVQTTLGGIRLVHDPGEDDDAPA
ncbi:MAG: hypothetical protein H6732_11100 [Alphaproteobacteria bacterium]|nr:hypothetical protein [Alphaproteobacteria bacterium]